MMLLSCKRILENMETMVVHLLLFQEEIVAISMTEVRQGTMTDERLDMTTDVRHTMIVDLVTMIVELVTMTADLVTMIADLHTMTADLLLMTDVRHMMIVNRFMTIADQLTMIVDQCMKIEAEIVLAHVQERDHVMEAVDPQQQEVVEVVAHIVTGLHEVVVEWEITVLDVTNFTDCFRHTLQHSLFLN